jgi:hypothetical protein
MLELASGLERTECEGMLLEALNAEAALERMAALVGVGRLKSARALPRIKVLLSDKALGVRLQAAAALGRYEDKRLASLLTQTALSEGEPEVRAALLKAVGASGDAAQIKPLAPLLNHSSETTRYAAAWALCHLGAKAGFAFAQTALNSSDALERRRAVLLFEGLPAKEAALLVPLLNDADAEVAAPAARVLAQGGDRSKLKWLVLKAFQAVGDDKWAFERELETFRLTDAERNAVLKQAGLK